MNIVNKLTLRQLKLNKKRTLVTIIGTIISAAMITAVATLGLSFMDVLQRDTIANGGEWHVIFQGVNKQQLETINSKKQIKSSFISRELGFAKLEGSQNVNKPYLYVKEYSTEGFQKTPIHLIKGRLPEQSDELVISEDVITNAKVEYKIGDVISINIGQRYTEDVVAIMDQYYGLVWKDDVVAEKLIEEQSRKYTIVGIIERPFREMTWAPGYSAYSYISAEAVSGQETFDVSVIYNKVNNKIFDNADKIGNEIGAAGVGFNNELLRYYGVIKDDGVLIMLYILTGIIMFIIVVGSVSLIYNAFAISVSERSRYLGMLSSVGATRKQKRNSVFFEGAVIGAISIPIGIAAGYAGLGITYIFINPILMNAFSVSAGFRLVIYPSSLIASILVSGATILVSTYIPSRRASNISAIDAIRQTTDIKIKEKTIRTLKLTRKLFGIEGDLGLKNLKRNKGRYKATVFSLIISIVIFLVVSYFTDMLRKSFTMTQDGINFDIRVVVDGDDEEQNEEIIQKVTSLPGINELSRIDTINTTTWIDEKAIADYLENDKEDYLVDGKYPYEAVINVMDEVVLRKYTEEIGLDYEKMNDTEALPVIIIDTMKFKDIQTDKYVETKVVKTQIGEQINLTITDPDTNEDLKLKAITVAGLTDVMPMGIMTLGKAASFHIIMTGETYDRLFEGNESILSELQSSRVFINSDTPLKLQEQIEKIQNEYGNSSMSVYNVYQFKQREMQAVILVSVFTYAFIILITAVCVANIINTISTSIALRKREFAMLKSIGITPKGFTRMLNYESIFYGIKALIYGIPIGILAMYFIYNTLKMNFEFGFSVSLLNISVVIAAVFAIVGIAMLYSSRKVRRDNIIDALKQEIV